MKSVKILVIDDDPYARDTISTIVKGLGYKVKAVASGIDAIKVLKKEEFDLVLLDVLMPGLSGKQVLRLIRKDLKLDVKVVLLTVLNLSDVGVVMKKSMEPVYFIDKASGVVGLKKELKRILKD